MAISLVASSKATTSSDVGSLSLTLPGGIAADDIILIHAYNRAHCTWSTPAGYTALSEYDAGNGDSAIYWRRATGSESGASVTIDPSGTTNAFCAIASVWRGVDTGTAFDATEVGANNASSSTVTCPSITSVTADAVWVITPAQGSNSGLEATFSTPGGFTSIQHAYATSTTGNAATMDAFYKSLPSAGASGTQGVSSNRTTTGDARSVLLRPATAGAVVQVGDVTFVTDGDPADATVQVGDITFTTEGLSEPTTGGWFINDAGTAVPLNVSRLLDVPDSGSFGSGPYGSGPYGG